MQKIDKQSLKEIVSSLMFEPTDEVIENILINWNSIHLQLEWLNDLDLENVKPLSHLNEIPQIDFLREDSEDISWSITKQDILKNAATKDLDYVTLTKVVK
ncbi:glutamyl-tRNA amidotransferase [Mycoplasmopsis gallopavonis]|uniref:Glutamyl-tRNA(Gln)amidotransferase subunit C n=1 Tax=Mycoplasmopsis gallopavonis TaxID=76629 RepID=A0A449AZ93_9BACT|nr:glutamyl-tRNA amidotransferase [Mycoplasmopsis gallopavonis]RIV16975.1 glutamyl-tRNA amidotransferase [Mycoplasmopsis gallopavonis]VEU72776.1 glutamyl-tRNA(gln)amidotransferase subunit C [Mycoplasmopsis gallopavonis]